MVRGVTILLQMIAGMSGRTLRFSDLVGDHPDLPCPWCRTPTAEDDATCPGCGKRFG
jgi:hypothetical protein